MLDLSLRLCKFTSFKQKRILANTFFRSEFKVTKVYQFQTKANSYEDICWVSVWSYVSLWVSNKSDFLWRILLSVRLKLSKFTSFKQKRILMKTFFESQFRVMRFYEFHTKGNSSEDICWVLVWRYLTLRVWNKTEFLWRHLLSLSLKLSRNTTFKQNRILIKTSVESQFEVM